jgi:replicative DNA helicase
MQNLIVKPSMAQATRPSFSLNMPGVDELFPGFMPGDFAILYGSPSVISLTSLLCVRAQLPPQLGGLGSPVVFIDGGNTFRFYNIARLAQLHQLDPQKVLGNIFISRAFTAYQLTSLIMEKLEETVKIYNAKVVVISDIAGFFVDNKVAADEAQRIYSQIATYLSNFARKHQIVIIATYLPYENSKRNLTMQEMTQTRASTVLRFTKTLYTREVALEKHPSYMLGVTELPSENRLLTDFIGVPSG